MPQDVSEHTRKVTAYFEARTAQYDAFYEPASSFERWFNQTFRKAVYWRRDRVLDLARRFDCKSVLDVGSGGGRNTVWWAREGIERLHGVDIAANMVRDAQQLAKEASVADRCTFEVSDFMEWDRDERWDMVVACGVFDYVVDGGALLRHMARFANRVIYGSFPGWSLVRSPLRKVRYALRGCPTHFYRRGEVERTLREVGFGQVEVERLRGGGFLAWSYRV